MIIQGVVFVLIVMTPTGLAVVPNHFFISLQLNTTWKEFCPQKDIFRIHLSNYARLEKSKIIYANEEENCEVGLKKDENTVLFLYVCSCDESNRTMDISVDNKETLRLEDLLKTVVRIGKYQILSIQDKNTEKIKKKIYTAETIGIVISVVLVIYLVGYVLIISMRSYSSRSEDVKERPISWIIAAENSNFTNEDGRPSTKTRRSKIRGLALKSTKLLSKQSRNHEVAGLSKMSSSSLQESYSKLPDY